MRTYLQHDAETGRLMLVMADYWNGQHETTAYTVVSDDGTPVRRGQEFSGLVAYREHGSTYRTRFNSTRPWITFTVKSGERAETVRTACPRAENRRRKCTICAAQSDR